ncbi:MAG TPA: phosphomethylpyrimidine synthase ThiC, partial [Methyloceanibacter sp.]|nr:phosphomethylpyrimidine synthase ThiC [Methyloceanibacter sp.]
MNKPISAKDVQPPKVSTGPLAGSSKIYSAPQGHDDVMVPFREIALTDGTSFRVHDTSGPYTDAEAGIDVNRGLKPLRAGWIAARGGGPVTQLELARAGIVTKEMVYIAHRENIGRQCQAEEAEARLADGESFGASIPPFVTPEFVRSEVARGRAIIPANINHPESEPM